MQRPSSIPVGRTPTTTPGSTLKYDASVIHPVEELQKAAKNEQKSERQKLAIAYGAAFPMRMRMQEEILSQFHRLPGLPSSYLGLSTLTKQNETFDFDDYLGLPEDSPFMPVQNAHQVMEKRLGIEDPQRF